MEFNRPDITLTDKINGRVYLIDISVPNSHNLLHKYEEKKTKYEELAREIKQLWKVASVAVIPLIISTTGLIPKTLKQNLERIGLPAQIYHDMQKAAILGTAN